MVEPVAPHRRFAAALVARRRRFAAAGIGARRALRRAALDTVVLASTTWLGIALGTAVASAQQPDAAADRAQSFQAVQGALKEDVPGGPLLVYAYGLIWLVMLLYVIRLARLQQHNQRELERLSKVLAKTPQ